MGKRLFLAFLMLISASTGFVIAYVQSNHFARLLSARFASQIENELGLVVDFDRLSIQAIPPGVAIVDPVIREIKPGNILNIPTDSVLKASEIGFTLRMLQTFGNKLVVNRVYLKDAVVKLRLKGSSEKSRPIDRELISFLSKPIHFRSGSGLELDVRQLEMRDCKVSLQFERERGVDSLDIENIRYFALRPERSLYSSVLDLESVAWSIGGASDSINSIKANFEIDPKTIHIISMDVGRSDGNLHVGGTLSGDLSVPNKLKPQIRMIARATTAGVERIVGKMDGVRGTWGGELLIEGSLADPVFKGKVEVLEAGYASWNFDKIAAEIQATKTEIKLSHAEVAKQSGKAVISNFSFNPKNWVGSHSLEISLDNFNFQDFAGELKRYVNNIEFHGNGKGKVRFTLGQGKKNAVTLLELGAETDFAISEFELNNQHLNKVRKKLVIFQIPRFQLAANVNFRDGNLDFTGSKISLPTGDIAVEGGVNKGVWNLIGRTTPIDVGAEVGRVAENEIRGKGPIVITTTGTADAIYLRFDMDLEDAKYINLDLGKLRGSLTLDDNESKLILKDAKGEVGGGRYEVDGIIDVSGEDTLNLRIKLRDMAPDELFGIFRYQLSKLTWIPWGMKGRLKGQANLGGRFTDAEKTLDLRGHLSGEKIIHLGELFTSLEADVALRDGTYSATDVVIQKHSAKILGNLSYSGQQVLQYRFNSERARVRDIDTFARLGIPMDGALALSGWGKGNPNTLNSHLEMRIENAHVGTFNIPPVFFRLDSNAERIEALSFLGDQTTKARLRLTRDERKNSDLEIISGAQDYSFLFCFLNQRFCGDRSASLSYSARFSSSWRARDWHKMSGSGQLSRVFVESDNLKVSLVEPVEATVKDGHLVIPKTRFQGTDTNVQVSASGQVSGKSFNGKIDGSVGLQLTELLTPIIQRASGQANLDVNYQGSLEDLRLSGKMDIEKGGVIIRGLTPAVEDLNGRLNFSSNRMRIERLDGKWGQGRIWFDGTADFFLEQVPSFNFGMNFQDNRIGFEPVNFAEIERGRLVFSGSEIPYSLAGKIRMRRVAMRQNFEMKKKGQVRASKYLPAEAGSNLGIYKIKIEAQADNGIVVQNDLLDAEFRGDLTIQNNFDVPQITGNATLIKGRLLFRNNIPFDLDHAIIKQTNPENLNPWFSLSGNANVNNYRVSIFANGNADNPKISLGSSPPLPQEDILSLLAFGYIERSDSTIRSDDRNAVTYTEAGSILLDQLKINKDLKSRGFNVRVGPTVIQKEANIIRPRDVPESAVPKILVQTQVAKNVEASLGTTVGSSQSQQFDVNVEYHLNDKVSVQSVYEQEPGTDAGETRTSFGGDLKFKWGFK